MANSDDNSRKLHPWLRVVRNGDRIVNAVRSDGSTKVVSAAAVEGATETTPIHKQLAQHAAVPLWTQQIKLGKGELPERPKLDERGPAHNAFVNVFIEFYPEERAGVEPAEAVKQVCQTIASSTNNVDTIPRGIAQRRNIVCATVPVPMLDDLEQNPSIAFIHPADPLKLDRPVLNAVNADGKPKKKDWAARFPTSGHVLVGIIDVGGFDFSHPDFLDENGTRFEAIWDQGGDFRAPPTGYNYGAEFRKPQLDAAIQAANKAGMPPAPWIERQSQLEPGSHATHVASIAAGNSGICPNARIAAVLIDVPLPDDTIARRRTTFSDTSRITHAVEYLMGIAAELDLPIAINISLGTNGGSHDGASGVSRWLDAFLATPGRAICVAAGNAGQDRPQAEGDLGHIMGRIHASGRIPASGLEVELEWTVIGDGIEDISENELEIWYGPQDRFTVHVTPPGEADEPVTVKPREYVENRRLHDGVTLSVYNELYHPTTGGNYIAIYLSPNLDPEHFRGIRKGVWRVRLQGDNVRDGRFNAWIERDDPMEIGRDGGRRVFRFPSFFTERTNVDSHSITSLACGHRVIAVANLDEARQQAHVSSSQGPTRDGRCKPEIAAPGTDVVAANGFGEAQEPWIRMTGTSMASPFVTGVVALMLAHNRDLTAAQCLGILQRTARPLAGASYEWANDVGYGRIDPESALQEALTINQRKELRQDGHA